MKKAIIINDLSGLGKCSLTAAIPVISVMGVQAIPLPTAVLSNQTGYDSYYCVDLTEHVDEYIAEWKKRCLHPDGIYTGFFTNAKQAEVFLGFINEFSDEETFILTDPVMGDQGEVYDIYSLELLEVMRKLAYRAQVITPNLTEALLLLYGEEGMLKSWKNIHTEKEIIELGEKLSETFHLQGVVITGIDMDDFDKNSTDDLFKQNSGTINRKEHKNYRIGTLVCERLPIDPEAGNSGYVSKIETSPKIGGSYSGTGDLFASVICAGRLRDISLYECVRKAMNLIEKSLMLTVSENTDRNDGICFEQYLYELAEG